MCERCKHTNAATALFCEKCSLPLDERTRQELKQKDMERTEMDKIMNELVKDKEVLELLVKKIKDNRLL